MRLWRRVHLLPAWQRWPLKLLAFALIVLLILFPRPWLLVTLLQRSGDLQALIDPAHPALAELERELGPQPNTRPAREVLQVVESLVYERVPYAFDWETHGVMEFVPTVGEVFAAGREDCDGRAVVAASLLKRMGYEAELATDFLHMWVYTPAGATMSPTSTRPSIRSGTQPGEEDAIVDWEMLRQLLRGAVYGVRVFPLPREIAILAAAVLLTFHPRLSWLRFGLGVLLVAAALPLVRFAGEGIPWAERPYWPAIALAGGALCATGWLVLAIKGRAGRPGCAAALPE